MAKKDRKRRDVYKRQVIIYSEKARQENKTLLYDEPQEIVTIFGDRNLSLIHICCGNGKGWCNGRSELLPYEKWVWWCGLGRVGVERGGVTTYFF